MRWILFLLSWTTCLWSTTKLQSDERPAFQISAAKGPYFLVDPRVVEDRWQVERFVVPPVRNAKNPLIVKQSPREGTSPHADHHVGFRTTDSLEDRRTGPRARRACSNGVSA